MLIYTDHTSHEDGPALLGATTARVRALAAGPPASHDDLVAALIELGTFESGLADAVCPVRDEPDPRLEVVRGASEAIGAAVAASWHAGDGAAHGVEIAAAALASLPSSAMPPRIARRTPEGYAFYAVYPEAYIDAAIAWAGTRRAAPVVCIGLRSIGTSLSAAVHGALTRAGVDASSWTLRPRGHPFDRRVTIAADLVRRWQPDRAIFLLVDEGPGLSGSSLAGAAAALSAIGVPDDRIVLMAAWHPDPDRLRSDEARRRWRRHTVIAAPFDCVRRRVLDARAIASDAVDLSAGRWRDVLPCRRPWPAVQPQHERLKLLTGDGWIVRFAGLGDHGQRARARAERLAAHGWTAAPGAIGRGLLSLRFAPGGAMGVSSTDGDVAGHAARYVAWLRRHEATGASAAIAPIAEMLRVNAREALGDAALPAVDRLATEAEAFAEPAVDIDGRLLPHEWIRAPHGLVKTDAIDHHHDHFLPGPTDAAWDVAGLIVEHRLAGGARESCVSTYVRASGDAAVSQRLPFYTAAYAAFRLGYCAMAEASVDETERRRFAVARARYAEVLRQMLNRSRT